MNSFTTLPIIFLIVFVLICKLLLIVIEDCQEKCKNKNEDNNIKVHKDSQAYNSCSMKCFLIKSSLVLIIIAIGFYKLLTSEINKEDYEMLVSKKIECLQLKECPKILEEILQDRIITLYEEKKFEFDFEKENYEYQKEITKMQLIKNAEVQK